ncbi:ribonuclease Z [Thiohalorhabdus methylotrophus]|uniref:Ribonuclease Z n=1 Tax=Thiohalorhabdus methylotrophus TaxID=3242694 RepID=A0ABV4TX31_9GAMM
MDLRLTFLGTGAGYPTPERNVTALAVERGRRLYLLDCGEGTLRALQAAGVGYGRLRAVLFSHFHADHCLGLPGLLQTFQLMGRERRLDVYGPPGTKEFVRRAVNLAPFSPGFCTIAHEVAPDTPVELDGLTVTSAWMDHSAPVLGYRLQELDQPGRMDAERARALGVPEGPALGRLKAGETVIGADGRTVRPEEVVGRSRPGRSLVFSSDTRPNRNLTELAEGADLLVHDSTFTGEHRERANETGHSTAAQAAATAREAGVGTLYLWHFSQRYRDSDTHLSEARAVFPATEASVDGLSLELPLGKD